MLIQVCLLLLSVGAYTSYAEDVPVSTTEDPLFSELGDMFPGSFLSRFPEESNFFTGKILVYLFFNLFAKYLGEHEPIKFWSKFNHNDFNRVAIDAAFYEYLTKFVDKKMKHRVFNPLESASSSPEDVAIHRIGDYLDSLSGTEAAVDQSETQPQVTETEHGTNCIGIEELRTPGFGISGKDFPDYCDIPKTSFTCASRLSFELYADIETRCQVFHICWPSRMDSFLCPIGTVFNQINRTCDFWQKVDCSEPTIARYYETRTSTAPPSTSTPELDITKTDILEVGGPCKCIMKILLWRWFKVMKFQPAKCEVAYLIPSKYLPPSAYVTDGECEEDSTDQPTAEKRLGDLGVAFSSIIKADELVSKIPGAIQQPELKMEGPTQKYDFEVVQESTESTLQPDDVDTSDEQNVQSTTELSSDQQGEFPPRMDSRPLEKSVFKTSSRGNVKYSHSVKKSSLLKPSKPSEETIKRVFDILITSLKLGSKMLNDDLLPFVEQIVLESHRKKASESKSGSVV